nr:hypothetical protein [Sphingomonas sp. Y57]
MSELVKIAFEQKVLILPIADLLSTKALPAGARDTVKYRRIAASVAEVDLIERLLIARRRDGSYLLLDYYMRLDALRFLEATEAACVVADDD